MKTQYNFKIEDELKQELDAIQQKSGVAGKEEFLSELLKGYKTCKANSVNTEIDLSKYETVSKQTKTVIYEAFKHILSTVESNSTNNKQQALQLEQDKLSIIDEQKSFEEQLEHLKAQHNQKLLDIDKTNKEQLRIKDDEISKTQQDMQSIEDSKNTLSNQLVDSKKELEQVQTIAKQVQSITITNKELRDELSISTKQNKEQLRIKDDETNLLNQKIKDLEQVKFKNELINQNKNKEIESLRTQLNQSIEKDKTIKELEKENIILSTKLEMITKSEKNK